MKEYKVVKVTGFIGEIEFTKYVATQEEGALATKDLRRMGCSNIQFPFDEMDALPKNYDELDALYNETSCVIEESDYNNEPLKIESKDKIVVVRTLDEFYVAMTTIFKDCFDEIEIGLSDFMSLPCRDKSILLGCNRIFLQLFMFKLFKITYNGTWADYGTDYYAGYKQALDKVIYTLGIDDLYAEYCLKRKYDYDED